MAIRPAKCYRKLERPYTRQSRRKPRKGYVKGVPHPKIVKFETGNSKKDFSSKALLIAEDGVQIRHNALEASRIAANKVLNDSLGDDGYFLKVLIYPHHVMRENPLATGAGADRYQTGMRLSFGNPIGLAARVKPGQKVMEIRFDRGIKTVKKALRIASSKLPVKCKIEA
ncbi:MAG: 50S ribosomal protein L16 [Candidatus Aenigmatarchaeota archaeon]|nr:MAG: 50S ribosomal protein L16 [Candidatus Aenigmarchaeota archaeon]